jgi:hypothetical protein
MTVPPNETDQRDQRIAQQLMELWSRCGRATLDFELDGGRAIIVGLHDGNVEAWRKRRKAHPSFRRISRLLGGIRNPSQLYNATCIYVLTQERPAVLTLKHLKASHFHAVAGLSADHAVQLLTQAAQEDLSVSDLRSLAAQLRTRGKGGRPVIPASLRLLRRVSRLELPPGDADLAALLKSVSPAECYQLVLALDHINSKSTELAALARHALPSMCRVLVIEADPCSRRTLARWLSQAGYAFQAVASAAEASAVRDRSGPFDVAVVGIDSGSPDGSIACLRRFITETSVKRALLLTDEPGAERTGPAKNVGEVLDRAELPKALFDRLHAIEGELFQTFQTEHQPRDLTRRRDARTRRKKQ